MGKKRKKSKGKAGEEELFGEERAPADRAAALREAGTPPHSTPPLDRKQCACHRICQRCSGRLVLPPPLRSHHQHPVCIFAAQHSAAQQASCPTHVPSLDSSAPHSRLASVSADLPSPTLARAHDATSDTRREGSGQSDRHRGAARLRRLLQQAWDCARIMSRVGLTQRVSDALAHKGSSFGAGLETESDDEDYNPDADAADGDADKGEGPAADEEQDQDMEGLPAQNGEGYAWMAQQAMLQDLSVLRW